MKILFVCTGNTCRSPMAEALFRKMAETEGLSDQLVCGSAGLSAAGGQPASPEALLCCQELGVDLSAHRSRPLTRAELPQWDLFFPMTRSHGAVLQRAGVPPEKIYYPQDIDDPFGGGLGVYRACRDSLVRELRLFYDKKIAPALGQ